MSGIASAGRREIDLIVGVLGESGRELSVSEIAELLSRQHGLDLTPRQVAYRLRQVPPELVIRSGERRGTRYRIAEGDGTERRAPQGARSQPTAGGAPAPTGDAAFSYSDGATEVVRTIRRPLHARSPVGYERDWLFSYVPGETWYLPRALREKLRRIGTPPGKDRLAGTFAREILNYLLIDLSWASSHLEGNTYSLLDTRNLIEFGQRAEGTDAEEAQMILNHKAAIEMLVSGSLGTGVSAFAIRGLHAALSSGLLPDARFEGKLRESLVGIDESVYQPTGIPQVIAECFERIAATAARIPDALEASFFLLVHLPYLQPFRDVNKRTSRIAANIPLVIRNLSPLSFVDTPKDAYLEGLLAIYEQRRIEPLRDVFAWAYERSCDRYVIVERSLPQPDPFRLRYRRQLDTLLADTVRGGAAPQRTALRAWARTNAVPTEDIEPFSEKALELLLALNDASAARVGIRPAEFAAWRSRFKPLDSH